MPQAPWFQNGLRFQCTQCGDCCTGTPGYVWVTEDEIAALAKVVGLAADDFEARYVRRVGSRKSLLEYDNGDCVFFDSQARKCKVYQARPRQCRTWPFWDSNIRSPQAWKETCQVCPGSGKGKLYSVEEVLAQSAVIKI
ncbi:MAG TPA: YkgJ family cysteine cluster protein [Pirellulales bacterium]|nr:YkgJ family cysteine cluster protein [Pirellulales bacterium]